jgi:hypothetical protein
MKKIGVGLKEVILSNIGEIVTSKNGEWAYHNHDSNYNYSI